METTANNFTQEGSAAGDSPKKLANEYAMIE